MTHSAIPEVAVAGWSWTTIGVGLLNLLVGGGLVAWIKTRPKMRELEQAGEDKLRSDLISRVAALEKANSDQQARFEIERAQHEATMAVMRHRLNNMTMCFDALLLLIETAPERAAESVVRIKEMRAAQVLAEAAEKGALHTAVIAATATTAP